ncbi:MAG: LysM peptidoglycan-binding domain-containing protein [Rubrivivax sp.]|nr:LysM peptidoglycan-binding domain-containing protein [Rubrivivax sp.]
MDRTTRLRRLALTGVAVAASLAACTTPPGGQPKPTASPAATPVPAEPAPAAEPPPAEPGPASPVSAQQAQRLAISAVEMLEVGHEEQALAEIQRALQADPANRLAQSLLRQIQTDPQVLLGREHFSYRVPPGESLSRIAGRFLNDVHLFYALARYNDIKVPRQLQGGQMIKVPGRAPAPSTPAPAAPPSPPPPAAPPPPVPAPAVAPPAPPPAATPAPRPPSPSSAEVVIAQEYRRGLSLMAQQKPAEAIEAFDQVLERDAGHANARLKRAQALSQVGGLIRLLENTIRRLDGQLAQDPKNAQLKAQRDKAAADRERLLTVK